MLPEPATSPPEPVSEPAKPVAPVVAPGDPPWFAEAAATIKPTKPLPWTDPAVLTPPLWNGHRLTDDQGRLVIAALRDPEAGKSLITALRLHIAEHFRDRFAWSLFTAWMAEGAPSAQKWAMLALGELCGAGSVHRLTPLIREWPGEGQHARAALGLAVLQKIGSDLALMELNGIALKIPFKALKKRAAACMDAIAAERGLSRIELDDRIIPDCGLDAQGRRVFDYGPRQFSFALGPELQPRLRDAAGKVLTGLPKASQKDDPTKVEVATSDWALLKKQIAAVITVQAKRLEQALAAQRRWSVEVFTQLLVGHPLMIHLVRRVIWGAYDAHGHLLDVFRVSEDNEFLDATDGPVDISPAHTIGLVHPAALSPEQRGAWGQVATDYGLISPFPQLGRPHHIPSAEELAANTILRLKGLRVPAATLIYGLDKLGWRRMSAPPNGDSESCKPLPAFNCSAIVLYAVSSTTVANSIYFGQVDVDATVDISDCYLAPGDRISSGDTEPPKTRLPLTTLDAVTLSEVINDITRLAARTK